MKFTKFLFGGLIALIMLMLTGLSASAFSGSGDGTEGDPYQITNCTQLQEVDNNLTADYVLINDVNCSDTVNWNSGNGFNSIGTSTSNKFVGSLNGAGYSINDLYINTTEGNMGLFTSIGSAGIVYNLSLVNVNITAQFNVGGLFGEQQGFVEHIAIIGGSITATSTTAGGLCGYNEGIINNSYSTAKVTSLWSEEDADAGGFCGEGSAGEINNCYATGSVYAEDRVGGFVGYNYGGIITNSYSIGAVTGSANLGGFSGGNDYTIISSYWDNETSGQSTSAAGEGRSTSEMQTQGTFTDWDFANTWEMIDYPHLQYEGLEPLSPFDGNIESGSYYLDQNYTINSTQTIESNVSIDCQGGVINKVGSDTAFSMSSVRNVTFQNCVFKGNVFSASDSELFILGNLVDGDPDYYLQFSGGNLTLADNVVQDAIFYQTVVDISGDQIIVRNNTFNNISLMNDSVAQDLFRIHDSNNLTFIDNVLTNNFALVPVWSISLDIVNVLLAFIDNNQLTGTNLSGYRLNNVNGQFSNNHIEMDTDWVVGADASGNLTIQDNEFIGVCSMDCDQRSLMNIGDITGSALNIIGNNFTYQGTNNGFAIRGNGYSGSVVIERNSFVGGAEQIANWDNLSNWVIRNNSFSGATARAISLSYGDNPILSNITIEDNDVIPDAPFVSIYLSGSPVSDNVLIRNNWIHGGVGIGYSQPLIYLCNVNVTLENNLFENVNLTGGTYELILVDTTTLSMINNRLENINMSGNSITRMMNIRQSDVSFINNSFINISGFSDPEMGFVQDIIYMDTCGPITFVNNTIKDITDLRTINSVSGSNILFENNYFGKHTVSVIDNFSGGTYELILVDTTTLSMINNRLENINMSGNSITRMMNIRQSDVSFINNSFINISGFSDPEMGFVQDIIYMDTCGPITFVNNTIKDITDLRTINSVSGSNILFENNYFGKHTVSVIDSMYDPLTSTSVNFQSSTGLLLQNNIFNESQGVQSITPLADVLFFNNTIIKPEFQHIYAPAVFGTGGCANCIADHNALIYNYDNDYTYFGMGLSCTLINNQQIINIPTPHGGASVNIDTRNCPNGLIENNTFYGDVAIATSISFTFQANTSVTIRNNNFTIYSLFDSDSGEYVPAFLLLASVRYRRIYADIYNNNFIEPNGRIMYLSAISRSPSGGGMDIRFHDNNFSGQIDFSSSKRDATAGLPWINFTNNNVNATTIIYAVINDSFSSRNYVNTSGNNFNGASLTLLPFRSYSGAILYEIGLSDLATQEIWFNTSNHIINVSDYYIDNGLATAGRTISGDGLAIDAVELGANSATTTLKNFIFNTRPVDNGSSIFVGNNITYAFLNASYEVVTPVEGQEVFTVIPVGLVSNYSSDSFNYSLIVLGINKSSSCVELGGNINCTVGFNFYDAPGIYDYEMSVRDLFGSRIIFQNGSFAYNELLASVRDRDRMTISGSFIGLDNVSVDVPITIRNAGNKNLTNVVLIAYDVPGTIIPSKKLLASYFRAGVNLSSSVQLENAVEKDIPFTLSPGPDSTLDFYLWVSAPADLYPQSYIATIPWQLVLES